LSIKVDLAETCIKWTILLVILMVDENLNLAKPSV
jgi:hypothetical protein